MSAPERVTYLRNRGASEIEITLRHNRFAYDRHFEITQKWTPQEESASPPISPFLRREGGIGRIRLGLNSIAKPRSAAQPTIPVSYTFFLLRSF